MTSTLVIMPVFNEEYRIQRVINQVLKFSNVDLVVVNDGSTDRTNEILEKYYSDEIEIIHHKENLGYGAALITGFNYAIKNNYEIVITIDADGQHDPIYIPMFLDEIKKGYDIVSGTRYHPQSPIRTHILENPKKINDEIVEFLKYKLGIFITDAFCGFKAYRMDKLVELNLTVTDYAFPLQVWVQAFMKGFRIKEIPVPLIFTNPRRNYDKILGSIEDAIQYFKKVVINEIEKFNKTEKK